jgi:trimethylamine--corrinoid protein Co-methyltransferase
LYDLGRLVDHLDHIHFFLRPCIPTDIPEAEYDVNMFYACLKATGKHVMSGVNDEGGTAPHHRHGRHAGRRKEQLQANRLFRDHLLCHFTAEAVHPIHPIMQECNRQGIPVALSAAPMSGSTSPMTMAGTLAQLHAEQLAGITICQLTHPVRRCSTAASRAWPTWPPWAILGGGVECGMMNAAIHQLAAHIQVPNYNSAGLTDAKLPDAQAGWEKAMTILLGAMGGSNYMHHSAGMLESMLTVAHEQFVIDDEIIGMACKVLKGIEVDADHLALDDHRHGGPGRQFHDVAPHHEVHAQRVFPGKRRDRQQEPPPVGAGRSLDTRERAKGIARKILEARDTLYSGGKSISSIREKYNILL